MSVKSKLAGKLLNRYLLIIRNEENFAEKSTFSFTYAKLIVFILTLMMVFMLISLILVKTLLAQWFDPEHQELEANRRLIRLSSAVDSLAIEVDRKDQFIDNLTQIIRGDDTVSFASTISNQQLNTLNRDIDLDNLPPIDSQFRKEFEEGGDILLDLETYSSSDLQEFFLFSPISGIVLSPYNAKNEHYGVDVVSKKNEPVKCVADGTVILSDWTQEAGYVISVQHKGNLISVYKHNSALLKKVGNFVKAGDLIAIIGNTGELTSGPHLHFELWYNGNPVNPEEFVSF
ncbi:MAG: M23 family metallopeptidase [Cyclobacteriaceae bacterium]|nr:M23 family metallopeptidase [Cyclobacteriaceae bacterium]